MMSVNTAALNIALVQTGTVKPSGVVVTLVEDRTSSRASRSLLGVGRPLAAGLFMLIYQLRIREIINTIGHIQVGGSSVVVLSTR